MTPPTSPIKAVLFDVAGVLTDSYGHHMVESALELGIDIEAMGRVLLPVFAGEQDTDSIGHRLERGEVALDAFLASLGELASDARKVLHPDSEHFFGHRLVAEADMHAFVDEVRDAGLATAIVSNTVREWHPTWERSIPPRDRFDVVVFSADVRVRKPNPEIFRLAIEQLGVEPHEALFLDDFAPMAQGARDAGLQAVHVADHQEAIAQARALLGLPPGRGT